MSLRVHLIQKVVFSDQSFSQEMKIWHPRGMFLLDFKRDKMNLNEFMQKVGPWTPGHPFN